MAKNLYFTPDEIIFRDENNNIRSSIFCASDNGIIISSSDQTTTTIKGNLAVTDGSITDGTATLAGGNLNAGSITATTLTNVNEISMVDLTPISIPVSNIANFTPSNDTIVIDGGTEGYLEYNGNTSFSLNDFFAISITFTYDSHPTSNNLVLINYVSNNTPLWIGIAQTLEDGKYINVLKVDIRASYTGDFLSQSEPGCITKTLTEGVTYKLTLKFVYSSTNPQFGFILENVDTGSMERAHNFDLASNYSYDSIKIMFGDNNSSGGSATLSSIEINDNESRINTSNLIANTVCSNSISDGTVTLSNGELIDFTLIANGNTSLDILKNNSATTLWTVDPENGITIFRDPNTINDGNDAQKMIYHGSSNILSVNGSGAQIAVESGGSITDGTATLAGGKFTDLNNIRIDYATSEYPGPLSIIHRVFTNPPSNRASFFIHSFQTSHFIQCNYSSTITSPGSATPRFHVTYTGGVYSNNSQLSSDDRMKHFENPIVNALDTVNKLKPTHYFKSIDIFEEELTSLEGIDGNYESGYIAQEVRDISELAFAVSGSEYKTDEDGNKFASPLSLDYNSIQPYLCKAIQELDVKNKALEATIKNQQTSIESLQSMVENLQSTVENLQSQVQSLLAT